MKTIVIVLVALLAIPWLIGTVSANENYLQFFKVFGDTLQDGAEDVIRVVENGVPYYIATGWTDMIDWEIGTSSSPSTTPWAKPCGER